MDWYSWLSKTKLDLSLIYEYSLLLSNNELEEEDISHFDHEFLRSMGISIAKHRLEILKLATKDKIKSSRLATRLLDAIKNTKRFITRYIHSFIKHDESAIVIVPRPSYAGGGRSKGDMLKRNKRVSHIKQGSLVLSGGAVKIAAPSMVAEPMACKEREEDGEDGYWGSSARWESMFQDLKPT